MPALEATRLRKTYGGRVVLDDVALRLAPGRVHALVGENGAGKSTLIACLSGLTAPDAGEVRVGSARLPPGDVGAALAAGIGVVHQHFLLADALTAAENVVLGAEPRRGPGGLLLDRAAASKRVRDLAAARGMPLDPDALARDLGVGERQRVEILKALHRGATTMLLDEPTAVLSPGEIGGLLDAIRALAANGAAVLLVSHKLDEVFAVADDITVLRHGRVTLSVERSATTRDAVARAAVGDAALAVETAPSAVPEGAPVLALDGVRGAGAGPFTFALRAGEALGVAGVEGNGQRALLELVAGVARCDEGTITLGGADVTGATVASRRAAGLGWVPEDRERRGLLSTLSVAENLALGDVAVATRPGGFDQGAATAAARAVIARFDVRPADPSATVASLSGGNQQKVLVARELTFASKVLVVAQPTRGIDARAAASIRAALASARDAGVALLIVSSELDELRGLCGRVMVLRGGKIAGEVPVAQATDATLGAWMVG